MKNNMTQHADVPARRRRRRDAFPVILVGPAVLLLLLVGLFPLIYSVVVSFQGLTMTDEDTSFQGLANYTQLFADSRLWESIWHTALITVIALPLEVVLGLLMALLLLEPIRGRQVFVALLVLPTMISPIVAGATWRLLFDNHFGPINQIVGWIVGHPVPLLWTVKPNLVYPSILICEIWQWTPFMFLLLLAALSGVDRSITEAAEIDGASYWQTLRRIELPAIAPVLAVAVLIRALDLARVFDVVWALTKGGPGTMTETVSVYAYVEGFQQFETSYTAAISFLIIALLSVLMTAAVRRVEFVR
jgi:multiple sugar transport system permease protein